MQNIQGLVGKEVEVIANGMNYTGILIEVSDTEVHIRTPLQWVALPAESVSAISSGGLWSVNRTVRRKESLRRRGRGSGVRGRMNLISRHARESGYPVPKQPPQKTGFPPYQVRGRLRSFTGMTDKCCYGLFSRPSRLYLQFFQLPVQRGEVDAEFRGSCFFVPLALGKAAADILHLEMVEGLAEG